LTAPINSMRNTNVDSSCGNFCHALLILSTEEKPGVDDVRPSAELHPRWQVNRVQIRAMRWTKWTAGSRAASFCVSGGVRGSTVLLQ